MSSDKGRVSILYSRPEHPSREISEILFTCAIFVMGRSFKRLERLEHLEQMELAQRLFLRLSGKSPDSFSLQRRRVHRECRFC
jgi:hypothetical protein